MMAKNKLRANFPLGGSTPTIFEDVPYISSLDRKIRFSLRDCDTGDYCIRKLSGQEISALYKRLGYLEQITWRDIRQLDHRKGFSVEPKNGPNDILLKKKFPKFSTYLHFRVNGTESPFRIFASLDQDLCYLLLIDPKGSINH